MIIKILTTTLWSNIGTGLLLHHTVWGNRNYGILRFSNPSGNIRIRYTVADGMVYVEGTDAIFRSEPYMTRTEVELSSSLYKNSIFLRSLISKIEIILLASALIFLS